MALLLGGEHKHSASLEPKAEITAEGSSEDLKSSVEMKTKGSSDKSAEPEEKKATMAEPPRSFHDATLHYCLASKTASTRTKLSFLGASFIMVILQSLVGFGLQIGTLLTSCTSEEDCVDGMYCGGGYGSELPRVCTGCSFSSLCGVNTTQWSTISGTDDTGIAWFGRLSDDDAAVASIEAMCNSCVNDDGDFITSAAAITSRVQVMTPLDW